MWQYGRKITFFRSNLQRNRHFFSPNDKQRQMSVCRWLLQPEKRVLKTFFFFIFILFFEYLEYLVYLVYLGRKLGSLFGAQLARLRHLTRCFPPETLDANLAYFLVENLDDDLFRTSADSPTVQDKTTRGDGGI